MNPNFESDLNGAVFAGHDRKIKNHYNELLAAIWPRVRPEQKKAFENKRFYLQNCLENYYRTLNMRIFRRDLLDKAQGRVDNAIAGILQFV